MKCLNCNYDNLTHASVCYRCGADLPIGTALTDADSVRVQRVDRLAARWRDMATEEIYQMEDDPERREYHRGQASALCMAANMIETEWAGSGPIDKAEPLPPDGERGRH
jgi:hypothetical protein